tara:strand:+ start:3026 stop:3673 length:648 start_codon:yes stop_codon:yes gene_type:complete
MAGTFTPIDLRDGRFSMKDKQEIFALNGSDCHFCSTSFEDIAALKKVEISRIRQAHHVTPTYALGRSKVKNGVAACDECHKKLHLFIDMFAGVEVNYKFLTAVYIHFFDDYPSNKMKKQFDYRIYADNLIGFEEMFWAFVEDICPTHVMYLVLAYCDYYQENKTFAAGMKHSYDYDRKNLVKSFEALRFTDDDTKRFYKRYNFLVFSNAIKPEYA